MEYVFMSYPLYPGSVTESCPASSFLRNSYSLLSPGRSLRNKQEQEGKEKKKKETGKKDKHSAHVGETNKSMFIQFFSDWLPFTSSPSPYCVQFPVSPFPACLLERLSFIFFLSLCLSGWLIDCPSFIDWFRQAMGYNKWMNFSSTFLPFPPYLLSSSTWELIRFCLSGLFAIESILYNLRFSCVDYPIA